MLQFDVVVNRLKTEYKVDAVYESVNVATARWVTCSDAAQLQAFQRKAHENLAIDGSEQLAYLAPTRVNLQLAEERYPEIDFHTTREH